MVATTSYQAGVESTLVQLAYTQESAWGVTPTAKLQALRFTGESLAGTKTRQRPTEINPTRQASAAVTTEETAAGSINIAYSYGTYDDLLSGLFGNDWTSNVLVPGTLFKSFTLEKRLGAALFLQYPGAFIGGGSLSMQRGQFLSGTLQVMAKQELKATTSASTGATYTAAPAGRVMDPVNGVQNLRLDGSAVPAVCNSINLNMTNEGAAGDYGLGSAAAQGMRMGTFTPGGAIELYFRDFGMYDRFKSETLGALTWDIVDAAGNKYSFLLPAAGIMNPKILAGGPNQPVMSAFDLEGNPDGTGKTLQITRTPIS